MKKPLIIIAGPTACGKTAISIELAKKINGEIISADSMQVYKYMDIGTAKADSNEMDGIKHYLIDEFYPDEEFNVMIFQQKAKAYMQQIYEKGKIPIIVGGTGFYINAVVNDNNFMEIEQDDTFRNSLYRMAEQKGARYLHDKLREIDPDSAEMIHANNIKRVARAIEFFELTGNQISKHNREEKQKESPYNVAFLILNMDREKLYTKIDMRVDKMISKGLVEEVKSLLDKGYSTDLVSMQGLGYKEIVAYLKGEITLENAIYELKKGTRHFAKRQLTWFKGQTNGQWIDTDKQDTNKIINSMCIYLKNRNLIKEY